MAPKGQKQTKSTKRKSEVKKVKIKCDICSKQFSSVSSLNSHKKSKHEGRCWLCPVCQTTLTSKFAYIRHTKRHHPTKKIGTIEAHAIEQQVYLKEDVVEMTEAAKIALIEKLKKENERKSKIIVLLRNKLKECAKKLKKENTQEENSSDTDLEEKRDGEQLKGVEKDGGMRKKIVVQVFNVELEHVQNAEANENPGTSGGNHSSIGSVLFEIESGATVTHEKVIEEVLEKYPHLIENIENIKLKIFEEGKSPITVSIARKEPTAIETYEELDGEVEGEEEGELEEEEHESSGNEIDDTNENSNDDGSIGHDSNDAEESETTENKENI